MIEGGSIVKGPFWDEPVRVDKLNEIGDYIRIIGSTTHSKKHIDQLIKKDELNNIEILEKIIEKIIV